MRGTRIVAAMLLVVVAGCAEAARQAQPPQPSPPHPSGDTRVLGTSINATGAPCGRATSATYRSVIWIWMENRDYGQVLGPNGEGDHLKSYVRRCAVATHYYALRHPSLPNYLAAVSGSSGGVTDDCDPSSCPQRRVSLFRQVDRAGRQWRGFAENMQRHCDRASYDGYAARHNPAVYFTPIHDRCLHWDIAMGGSTGTFATALKNRSLRAFTFVTPNLCHDGHDCTTATADDWLGRWLDRIVASPAYAAGHTVVFVTWDEGLTGSANRVPMVVIAPSVTPGTRTSTRLSHYSLLRTTEKLLGLPLLGRARYAHGMLSML